MLQLLALLPLALAPQDALPSPDAFARLELAERRSRAKDLVREGEDTATADVRAILAAGEPDHVVRRALVDFLARADHAPESDAARADAILELARRETRADLLSHAIDALATMRAPAAGEALDQLIDVLGAPARGAAARALGGTQVGREAIFRRVTDAAKGRGADPPSDVLAPLLAAFGGVLADRQLGSFLAVDVAPLVGFGRHLDSSVRVGARLGLENLITRCAQLSGVERVESALDALEDAGWSPEDLDYRRAVVALTQTDEPERALLPARRLAKYGTGRSARDAQMYLFYGKYFEAVAFVATDRADRAMSLLDDAGGVMAALSRARHDLRPVAEDPTELRREQAVDFARKSAQVELMRAIVLIRSGKPGHDAEVVSVLSRTVARLVEAHVLAQRWGVDVRCDLDAILDDDLGPRRLLYDNTQNPDLSRDDGIELMKTLGRGFASVARAEMPGFEPFAELGGLRENPLRDERGFRMLFALSSATEQRLQRDLHDPETSSERARRQIYFRWDQIRRDLRDAMTALEEGTPRHEAYEFLLRQRDPSQLALWLSRDLRAEGRAAETRELAERMLEDLRASGLSWDGIEAEIRLAIASSYTEEDRPQEAEEVLLAVLDSYESTLAQYEDMLETSREEGDTSREGALVAAIRRQELRIADCLVSLAVNANVRMNDGERAIEYFERAFELNQSDFYRVLLACYRARAGRFDEARAELREIAVAPAHYYNMACTWALMGESRLALDFLAREFEESQLSRGALERQKAWARDDPDLSSLRGDERFERLTAPSTETE